MIRKKGLSNGAWVLILAITLVMIGCSNADTSFPDSTITADIQGAGGAVFVDASGDQALSAGEKPVERALINPLWAAGAGAEPSDFAVDPNAATTESEANGSFVFSYASVPAAAAVRVDVDAVSGAISGALSYIVPIDPRSFRNQVALPHLPQACDPENCPVLPPDLTPIVSWDRVDPKARLELEIIGKAGDGFLPPETWFVETDADGRRLLRFASVTANIGEGPLDIISLSDGPNLTTASGTPASGTPASGTPASGTIDTVQRLWTETWEFTDQGSGEFLYHPDHEHIHFDAFERYRLIDAGGEVVAESQKVSFCLRDSLRISDEPEPTIGIFGPASACGASQQAINPGFADHYNQFLPDQWIDITGVAPGAYMVEITVDPLEAIIESDETNNTASFPVTLTDE